MGDEAVNARPNGRQQPSRELAESRNNPTAPEKYEKDSRQDPGLDVSDHEKMPNDDTGVTGDDCDGVRT
jgi:hypothetical protein